MRMAWLVALGAALGCGGSSVAIGDEAGASNVSLAGQWAGDWISGRTGQSGPIDVTLDQNGSVVTGSGSVTGTCSTNGPVRLDVSGRRFFGALSDSVTRITLTGDVTSSVAAGSYSVTSTNECSGDTGTFSLRRKSGGGGSGTLTKPPVIDTLDMPERVRLGKDGYFTLEGNITFHDDDDGVALLRVGYTHTDLTWDFPIAGAPRQGKGPVVVKFDSTRSGYDEYTITLVDVSGAKTTQKRSVNLDTD